MTDEYTYLQGRFSGPTVLNTWGKQYFSNCLTTLQRVQNDSKGIENDYKKPHVNKEEKKVMASTGAEGWKVKSVPVSQVMGNLRPAITAFTCW